ncbi:DUF262 domain-containing protein [Qipengyuania seohaensis]|uniref:DUF262 domain-containing protein n=1 Tax=Qipengyuania seohaensis TaxID=266951 RepID=UPI000C225618|nr:DUF262 domain-containing protein [Qipengyuania seohaensis]
MKASAESRRIGNIIKAIREGALIPRPDFQRRAVWTNPDKVAFIDTILSGYPFPEIYIATQSVDVDAGDVVEMLVDGQQRMRTVFDYFTGVSPFKNSRSITAFKDLTKEQKEAFLAYEVAVRNLGINDDETIRGIFRRMNRTSYSLNDMERYNAAYLGQFKKFSEALAEDDFIKDHKIFSSTDVRRMRDVSYIASLTATMMSNYFNRDSEVEEFLENYNEEFSQAQEVYSRYQAVFDFLTELDLSSKSRAWRKVDFYNLATELDRLLFKEKKRPVPEAAKEALANLYAAVDEARENAPTDPLVEKYFSATLQNTNDRAQRIMRGEVLKEILGRLEADEFEVAITELPFDIEGRESDGEVGDALAKDDQGATESIQAGLI